MAVASGACVHQRPRDGHQATDGPVPTPLSPPSPSSPASGAAPSADAGPAASHTIPSPDRVASVDDSPGSDGSTAASVPSTWIVPDDAVVSSPRGTPPLSGEFEQLSVVGQPDVFVSLPTGATSLRPVVIVIHGAGDRPERQCRGWRRVTKAYPFIVCPTGRASPRYTHIGGAPLLEYIDQTLQAAAARYPDYVDTNAPLLAGFSLGARQVTELAVRFPARFPRIALVEGATTAWTGGRVSAFLQGGGQRVLFGCGQEGVRNTAERTAKWLAKLGVSVHVVFASVGHNFAPSLEDAVRDELAWLMDGDPRWPSTP